MDITGERTCQEGFYLHVPEKVELTNIPSCGKKSEWNNFFSTISLESDEIPYLCPPKFWKIMFAVVKIAGQQFRVEAGQKLYVPHLQGNAGDKVSFSDVLLVDNNGQLTVGGDVSVKVNAEILGERQGDKVIAFKMKRRKGFRKKIGHRKLYTQLKIESIA
jgi:large subunit ribosomal protein L21